MPQAPPLTLGPQREAQGNVALRVSAHAARPAFDEVYDEHAAYIGRSLRRLGVMESAIDDALQDVFVVVHRQLAGFQGVSSVRTWLYAIALRVARDHRRSARRKGHSEPLDAQLPDQSPGPADEAESNEALRVVQRLIDHLSDEKREVFVMAELEQLTIPEMAAILGVNHNTLYARLRAARTDFERLADRERRRAR